MAFHFMCFAKLGVWYQGSLGFYIYIYINPRTQMTLVLIGKGFVLGGVTFKNRGRWGSRCIYMYIYIYMVYYFHSLPNYRDL